MNKLRNFLQIYRLYRSAHSPIYAARIAYGCAFRQIPF
jgi:hypothetical protein